LLKTAEDDGAFLERAGGGWTHPADVLMPLDARGARRLMELTFYRKQAGAMLPDFVIRDIMKVTKDPYKSLKIPANSSCSHVYILNIVQSTSFFHSLGALLC
jgi:hypothetical protein